jgi:Flp pilus assembly protein TadD
MIFTPLHIVCLLSLALFTLSGCAGLRASSPYLGDTDYKRYLELKEENKPAEAITALAQAHQRFPNNSELALRLAELNRKMHHYNVAAPLYAAAIPKLAGIEALQAKEALGLCYLHLGRFQDSGAILAEVLAQDATKWHTINAFGVTLALTNQAEEAIEYFKLAEELSHQDPAVLNNFGLLYAMEGRYAEAKPLLERAFSHIAPSAPERGRIALNLAMVYGASGNLVAAEKMATPHLPSAAALHHNLAVYALLARDKNLAKKHLSKALASPQYTQASWELMKGLED